MAAHCSQFHSNYIWPLFFSKHTIDMDSVGKASYLINTSMAASQLRRAGMIKKKKEQLLLTRHKCMRSVPRLWLRTNTIGSNGVEKLICLSQSSQKVSLILCLHDTQIFQAVYYRAWKLETPMCYPNSLITNAMLIR